MIWVSGLDYHLARAPLSHQRHLRRFVLLAGVPAQLDHRSIRWQAEVAPITGPMYQLFVFFMITDPKTTVRSKIGTSAWSPSAWPCAEFF